MRYVVFLDASAGQAVGVRTLRAPQKGRRRDPAEVGRVEVTSPFKEGLNTPTEGRRIFGPLRSLQALWGAIGPSKCDFLGRCLMEF